ncbi:MAG: hypothetical protein KDC71_20950 [Acidobacteria bacterium]|nr:hypothetical protein [Acidobacteriota bacterium]
MGYTRWNQEDWKDYAAHKIQGKQRQQIFAQRQIHAAFDPRNITLRESRDSELNPESNAIIVAFDETGSMGAIPEAFIRTGLQRMVTQILDQKPVTDPHLMIMGFGDAWCDRAPLQVSQFEADIRIVEQLSDIYLEGGGGGNHYESYNLPWYFAATRTEIDCWQKRGKKGVLFTVGDEPPAPNLTAKHARKLFGDRLQQDLDSHDVLAMAREKYDVYHIVIEQGSYFRQQPDRVRSEWRALLGQSVLYLNDYTRLAELIVETLFRRESLMHSSTPTWTRPDTSGESKSGIGFLSRFGF